MSDLSIVEVTQADRAAAFAVSPFRGPGARNRFLSGTNDAHPLVQAFARHRASEAERVREACAKVAEAHPVRHPYPRDERVASVEIAAAIRSLPIGGGATDEDIVHAVEFRDVAP